MKVKRVLMWFMILVFVVGFMAVGFAGEKKGVAEQFFISCNDAFKLKDFSALKKFFDKHSENPSPEQCFKLNNSEFLITVTDTARVAQGLYLVDMKLDKMTMDGGYGLVNIAQEFLGKNKKRYVLLSFGNLSGGIMSSGYEILNLIPTTNGKSYTRYSLFEVSEDAVGGLCGEKSEEFIKEGINAETIASYKILDERTQNVTLVFYITREDCKTSSKKSYIKKFRLVDGVFKSAN